MRQLKSLLTFALCLIVLATSVTQAVARGQMATGQMVQLCADGVAVTVMIDAQGKPLDPQHRCPDCLTTAGHLPHIAPQLSRPIGRCVLLSVPDTTTAVAGVVGIALARGPPVLI